MRLLTLLCFISFSHFLYADEETLESDVNDTFYLGGAFVTWNYDESGEVYSPISFEGMFDYELFNPLEISLRLGMGFGDAENEDVSNRTVGVDLYKLLYFKPYLSFEDARLYALFGYADYDISSNTKAQASGVSYGIGADYNLFDVSKLFIEWRTMPDNSAFELSSISIGLTLPY
ncbi:MAG: outer membrane beta-barrel protein [Marinomonas sp.]